MKKTAKAATGTTKKAATGLNSASCISNGGLAPWSRGTLTPDQVCARDFNPKLMGGEPTKGCIQVYKRCKLGLLCL